jgi:sugar phosphate isomerase/epimerase
MMQTPTPDSKEKSKRIEMHIHSFSLRFQFKYRTDFDVFGFIALAQAQGFTGVNISANGPRYRDLGGTTDAHFEKVKNALLESGMRCEIDTSDTRLENLLKMLDVAGKVNAECLRVYTKYPPPLQSQITRTVEDLRAVIPALERTGITLVFENHEDFQGKVIADILNQVHHPLVRALYDYGNSQMVCEEPLNALEAMAPFVSTVHVKDHVVVVGPEHAWGNLWVQGVPMGQGRLPIMEQTQRLYDGGLRRFCFENVWGYAAPLKSHTVPKSDCFGIDPATPFLNGADLPKEVAVDLEWKAFEAAWSWYKTALAQQHYQIGV